MKVFKLNLFFYPRKKIVSFQTNVLKKILLLKYSRHHFVIRDRHGSPEWRGLAHAPVHFTSLRHKIKSNSQVHTHCCA